MTLERSGKRSGKWGIDLTGRPREFAYSYEDCLHNYSSAGFLVTSEDGKLVLLGTHNEAPNLWGNFAGKRDPVEIDPKVTACRELAEELGLEKDPNSDLGEPYML